MHFPQKTEHQFTIFFYKHLKLDIRFTRKLLNSYRIKVQIWMKFIDITEE